MSTSEWMAARGDPNGHGANIEMEEIHPESTDDSNHHACFVISIENGRTWGGSGAIITLDDTLLSDVSRQMVEVPIEHAAFSRVRLGNVRRVDGRIAVLTTPWSDVYFHWMYDLLPRLGLLALSRAGSSIEAYIVPQITRGFQDYTLAKFGIVENKRIEVTDSWSFHLQAKELVVPSLPSTMGAPPKWICEFLRQQFSDVRSAGERARRLYISRAGAFGRNVVNEEDLLAMLSARGFESVCLDHLSVTQQAALFGAAEWIVAPHGGALSNLCFCQPGTRIIDIVGSRYGHSCYQTISKHCGLAYERLVGTAVPNPASSNPKHDNIVVDVEALKRILDTTANASVGRLGLR